MHVDLIDFIDTTFGVRVSRVALARFLKKFGLDRVSLRTATEALPTSASSASGAASRPTFPIGQGQSVPTPTPPFSPHARSTPVPSS